MTVTPDPSFKSVKHEERGYRNVLNKGDLVSFNVVVNETDLLVHAPCNLEKAAKELVIKYRGYIENYIKLYPDFIKTMLPWKADGPMPLIIKNMIFAGENAGVGPMAAVAGAIAEHVGKELLQDIDEVVVENGGDVFLKTNNPVVVGIFAGKSPLSMCIGLKINTIEKSAGVCTSSGTVGHSFSYGNADAVCVVSDSCSIADTAATSIGNRVKSGSDIQAAIDFGKNIKNVQGILVIVGEQMGMWGKLETIPLK